MNVEFKYAEPNEPERTMALTFSVLFCLIIYVFCQQLKKILNWLFGYEDTVQQKEALVDNEPISSSSLVKSKEQKGEQPLSESFKLPSSQADSVASPLPASTPSESQQTPSLLLTALQDGVCTFAVCVCSLENGVIRSCLGMQGVLFAICSHSIITMQLAWKDSYGSACNAFYRYVDGRRTTLLGLLASWTCQFVGAFVALRTSFIWWGMRATTYHSNLFNSKLTILHQVSKFPEMEGVGDLNVPISTGMLIEGGSAFVDVFLAGLLTAAVVGWRRRHGKGETEYLLEGVIFTIRQATMMYLVAIGLPLTGAYVNPVNAVIQTWGLGNAQPIPHILVYWFSPMLGILVGYHLVRLLTVVMPTNRLCFPLAACAVPASGAQVLEQHLISCPHSTQANVQTESDPEFLFASVNPAKKTKRCRSQTRSPKLSPSTAWRRSSECRFLPQNLGDSVCRRCPVVNSSDNSVFLKSLRHYSLDDDRCFL